ncbi:MAG: amidohydrolase family protein [Acidobacteriota bacterium]|nr:amidohydrolase family protein [Acidobacteriota bacterium]
MIILANIATLYDGSGSTDEALHRSIDVLIENGRISSVEPHRPEREIGEDIPVVDCSGMTATPGLIDCHSHITLLGVHERDMENMNSPEGLLITERILYTTLVDGGVTTLRDVGGATQRMKRLVENGTIIGPRMKIAICMLSSTGGHADFRGPDRCHATLSKLFPEGPGRPSSIVDGPWECRKRVREIAACGADLIKLCTSPGVGSPGDKLEHREFTAEEIQAICDEARGRGLRVAAHAHSRSGIRLAVEHGVNDIQHISFMGEREVDMAYKAGCTVTPTSWIIARSLHEKGLQPSVVEKVKQVNEVHASAVAYARSGGLKILVGTDPVFNGMHGRNYMELHALIQDGLKPLEAWHGATGLAATEIEQDDTGRIQPGYRADLLLCKAESRVLDQPENMETGLVEVFKDGVPYRGAFSQLPAAPDWHRRARDQVN